MPDGRQTEWHESPLLWGCASTVVTIVIGVLAVMLRDARWLLTLAWPFATVACWEFARTKNVRHVGRWTTFGSAVAAVALEWLYWALAPAEGGVDLMLANTKLNIIPIMLIVMGLASAVIGLTLWKSGSVDRSVVIEKVEPTPIGSNHNPVGSPGKPTKIYSKAEQDELRDAMRDISKMLDGTGDDIVQKTTRVFRTWDLRSGPLFDLDLLIKQLDELADATVILNRTVHDPDGLLKRHISYDDEINSILRLPENSPGQNALTILQMSRNNFRDGITAIKTATKYNDVQLLDQMQRGMTPSLFHFQDGILRFVYGSMKPKNGSPAFGGLLCKSPSGIISLKTGSNPNSSGISPDRNMVREHLCISVFIPFLICVKSPFDDRTPAVDPG